MSQEVVKDYLVENGGITRNVDLVRHFRKFLQSEDLASKGEKTNTVFQRAGHVCAAFNTRPILTSVVFCFHRYPLYVWCTSYYVVERNRETFKNFVNALAAVKSEGVSSYFHQVMAEYLKVSKQYLKWPFFLPLFLQGEKFIILKPKFYPVEWGGVLPSSIK